jgi:hypothetical protein
MTHENHMSNILLNSFTNEGTNEMNRDNSINKC